MEAEEGGEKSGGGAVGGETPFVCDSHCALSRKRRLSYRCPDVAPSARLESIPLGMLPIPYQLPGEVVVALVGGGAVVVVVVVCVGAVGAFVVSGVVVIVVVFVVLLLLVGFVSAK